MILVGLKNINTGVGQSENDWSSVNHQQLDIIAGSPSDTTKTLTELYHAMVKKGKGSYKKLGDLDENLEFSYLSEEEYEKLSSQYSKDCAILKYDRVLIIEGHILK